MKKDMTATTNKITVKEWIASQKIEEAHRYHLSLCRQNNEDGTVTFDLEEPVLKETDKAIYVAIKTETYSETYHAPMRFWIPKSQVIA